MYKIAALAGLKMHANTPHSGAFTRSWRSRLRCKISVPDLIWKGLDGQMAHLVADSEGNKGQLPQVKGGFSSGKMRVYFR